MLALAPARAAAALARSTGRRSSRPRAAAQARVALLTGCAQQRARPRDQRGDDPPAHPHGVEVVVAEGAGCCGALDPPHGRRGRRRSRLAAAQHRRLDARDRARRARRHRDQRLGLRHDGQGLRLHVPRGPGLRGEGGAGRGARRATSPRSWTSSASLPAVDDADLVVAYHSACSLQHGQQHPARAEAPPRQGRLHGAATMPEGHLCCGSAGTYNMLQPEIAGQLRDRKVANIERDAARRHRHRQHRLHHADRRRHRHPDRPHGRAARLGDRRAAAGGAQGRGLRPHRRG